MDPAASKNGRPKIGVLALQGDFQAHSAALERAGARTAEVRTPGDLTGLDGLVLPGGESTTLLRLMRPERMDEALASFCRSGGALLATCAGLIILAREVTGPAQESLALCDVAVRRNGYGRQIDSFVGRGRLALPGEPERAAEMVMIRAPRITGIGGAARAVGWLEDEPVLVAQGRILAATFHPEMSTESPIHLYFVKMAAQGRLRTGGPAAGPAGASTGE
jgi:pyridoxal 5'-phosphate synthase pdxT subunit